MSQNTLRVADIRRLFVERLQSGQLVGLNREGSMTQLVGSTTLEIVGASFIADEDSIFGQVNWDYVRREEEWYNSQSLNVNDIPGGTPQIWRAVADPDGFINSNYGWAIYSTENVSQFERAVAELKKNPDSRRATMIYTRPQMWDDYNKNGRSDFMCTNAVGYLVRDGRLHAHVQMRSNDAWAGFRNDRAWQRHVLEKMATDLNMEPGDIYWSVTSLHIYARQYYLVHHCMTTGETHISKDEYAERYPNSPYL
jgi:thymidylate synthase